MAQNYLGGENGVKINALISGCAWSLKKMKKKLKETFLQIIFNSSSQKMYGIIYTKRGW